MKKNKKKNLNQFFHLTGVLLFGLFIFLVIGNILHKDKSFSETENRMLAEKPEASLDAMLNGRFESNYEKYVNDQFVFRDAWISLKGMADTISGKQESNGVYRAGDGYLIEDFVIPDADNVNKIQQSMEAFKNAFPNLKQYFLLAPTAVNVMKKELPIGAPVGNQNLWMDQLYQFTQDKGYLPIDVRTKFADCVKNDIQLYYKTDHHWTTRGAYEAFSLAAPILELAGEVPKYQSMVVSNHFRGTLSAKSGFRMKDCESIEVWTPSEQLPGSVITYVSEQEKTGSFYKTENLAIRDAYTVFLDGNHAEVKIESPVENGKRLLVLKDSYANCFLPFIAPYYRKIIVVDPRYYYDDLNMLIQTEEITDILFLYNANTFFQDTSLAPLLEAAVASAQTDA